MVNGWRGLALLLTRCIQLHPDVYEPAEDTDLLRDALRQHESWFDGRWCADVGTGTGAVALALQEMGARVVAVDLNPHATILARENGVEHVARADLLSALCETFDVVTFNAPYLPTADEERVPGWLDHAFHGGEGGIEVSERFVRDLPRILAPGGRGYLVVSSRAELDRLRDAARQAGLAAEVVATTRFFFEELAVWRLTRAAPADQPL